jgi:hypothetical protein
MASLPTKVDVIFSYAWGHDKSTSLYGNIRPGQMDTRFRGKIEGKKILKLENTAII